MARHPGPGVGDAVQARLVIEGKLVTGRLRATLMRSVLVAGRDDPHDRLDGLLHESELAA